MDLMTAWAIVYDIARTKSAKPEVAAFGASARTLAAELAGLPRADVHFVPFYSKTHMARILQVYSERVDLYMVSVCRRQRSGQAQ